MVEGADAAHPDPAMELKGSGFAGLRESDARFVLKEHEDLDTVIIIGISRGRAVAVSATNHKFLRQRADNTARQWAFDVNAGRTPVSG